eukprot:m.730699 g.730699  ORF g.730699 m.730699 type:complete len:423 (-) comp23056_c0_seq7:2395-3663(-)
MATPSSALPAVQCICDLVKSFGVRVPSPEVFRGAKHNVVSSISPMLRLLHDVLVLHRVGILHVLCEAHVTHRLRVLDAIFEGLHQSPQDGVGKDGEDNLLVLPMIQLYLADAGYTTSRSDPFMEMTPSVCSSRELLLAFGWCLSTFEIVRLWILSRSAHPLTQTKCGSCHRDDSAQSLDTCIGTLPSGPDQRFEDLLHRTVATIHGNKHNLHSLAVEQREVFRTQQKLETESDPSVGHRGVHAGGLVRWWQQRLVAAEQVQYLLHHNLEVWWQWLRSAAGPSKPMPADMSDSATRQRVLAERAKALTLRKRHDTAYTAARSKWNTMLTWPEVARKDFSGIEQEARDHVVCSASERPPTDRTVHLPASSMRLLSPDGAELDARIKELDGVQQEVAATVKRLQDSNDAQLKLLLLKLPDLVRIR